MEVSRSRSGARRVGFALLGAGIALLMLGGGCQRDPLDRTVKADSARAFAIWQAHLASDSGPELRRRVEEAVQEIRLQIAGERELKRALDEPMPPDAKSIDEALRDKLHDRPLRDVLQLGYELRVRRLTQELAGLEDAMKQNAQLITRPGDVVSRHHLEGLRDRQKIRVDKYREDLAKAERELGPLVKASGKQLFAESVDTLDVRPERKE